VAADLRTCPRLAPTHQSTSHVQRTPPPQAPPAHWRRPILFHRGRLGSKRLRSGSWSVRGGCLRSGQPMCCRHRHSRRIPCSRIFRHLCNRVVRSIGMSCCLGRGRTPRSCDERPSIRTSRTEDNRGPSLPSPCCECLQWVCWCLPACGLQACPRSGQRKADSTARPSPSARCGSAGHRPAPMRERSVVDRGGITDPPATKAAAPATSRSSSCSRCHPS
jgi:hypothetical protein